MEVRFNIKKTLVYFFFICILLAFINLKLGLTFLMFLLCFDNVLLKKEDLFKPSNYYMGWFFYYFGFGNLCYSLRCSMGIAEKHSQNIQVLGMLVAVLFIIVLKFFMCNTRKIDVIKFETLNVFFIKNNLPLILVFIVIETLLMMFFWYKLGGIPLFIEGYHDSKKASLGVGLGYLEYLISFLQYPFLMCIMAYISKGKKDKLLKLMCIFFYFIFLPLLNDSRSQLINNVIMFFVFYSWNKKQIPFRMIILGGLALVLLATVWGIFRSGSFVNGSIILLLEIAVEYDNYLDVLDIFPRDFDFTLGWTYIACITLLFPRKLMPNKNDFQTGGEYYKTIKHHDYIRVGERFTFQGECYMNFGFIGIIIGMFIILNIIKFADSLYEKRDNFIYQAFSYFFMGFSVSLLAGDTASAFSASFISFCAFLLIILFLETMNIKKRRLVNDFN